MVKARSLSLTLSRLAGVFWLLAVAGFVLAAPALILAGIVGAIALVTIAFMPRVGVFTLETAALASRPGDQLAASFPALSTVAPSRPLAPGHRPPRALLAA
ncbi:MAG: hypothetical protein HKUEN07_04100 [Rhodocyclaceae bacterium]|jgi:hypothetical protein|uniref:Uncharacterized protein n=1 Tax=Candidatus Desulfobacillus denitrificans TaxID=2608985 RepID=A0A809RAF1_9PROT|nr:hypothetical protein [Rhodocyclaceae bacterium]BBO21325.1 hypothetical protein DSYM_20240 [Candidatus Desulfobacillus denitrificans]GIK46705.1 MAG: hypothetical protein BroJett012_26080 [Betaproteobacteria bacterium]GJQ53841.1 MAG: hypothetical protein HKUEN07_04100 [Rhodocyclaceae bacterium]